MESTENTPETQSTETPPRKYKTLRHLYETTQRLDFDDIVDYALFSGTDPISHEEASKDIKWRKTMDEEIQSIQKNKTWNLVELPKGHKAIGVK